LTELPLIHTTSQNKAFLSTAVEFLKEYGIAGNGNCICPYLLAM
jgi:hypothetical protein